MSNKGVPQPRTLYWVALLPVDSNPQQIRRDREGRDRVEGKYSCLLAVMQSSESGGSCKDEAEGIGNSFPGLFLAAGDVVWDAESVV